MSAAPDRWLARLRPLDAPAVRLVCFPYAGGGAIAFRSWLPDLPDSVELLAAQLPGRGLRFREPPVADLERMADSVTAALRARSPGTARPPGAARLVFFGHSLGALLAFEVARRLAADGDGAPHHLLASACRAPQLPPPPWYDLHNLSDAALHAQLRRLNGTPAAVLDEPELLAALMPAIRADFAAYGRYRYAPGPPLACPITVLSGDADPLVSDDALAAWQAQTQAAFALHRFAGDHFYLHDNRPNLLATIRAILAETVL